jgi:hypothetical protein
MLTSLLPGVQYAPVGSAGTRTRCYEALYGVGYGDGAHGNNVGGERKSGVGQGCPCMYERNPYCPCDPNGTVLPAVVCDVCADGSVIGWQNGQC